MTIRSFPPCLTTRSNISGKPFDMLFKTSNLITYKIFMVEIYVTHWRIEQNCCNCFLNKIGNRGEKLNLTSLEEWMSQGKAPALENSLKIFNEMKARGLQIILVSSRREHLRSATIDNLVNVGYYGWTSLILRSLSLSVSLSLCLSLIN